MNEKMRKSITAVLVVIFVISTVLLIVHSFDTAEGAQSYEAAEELAGRPRETVPTEETEPTEPVPEETVPTEPAPTEPQLVWAVAPVEEDEHMKKLADINLEALREKNPTVAGWIFVPNTRINYPIVQGEDNQYYLSHTWDNHNSVSGAIFLETTNSPDFTDFRTLVYGHNMADSSMFGALHRYSNEYYWEQYPYVYIVTDEGVLRYEIYSSYKAAVESGTYALELTDETFQISFLHLTLEESEIETGITPALTDRLLTLSTCVGNAAYRRVVHARLPMIQVEMKTDSPQN